MAKKIVLGVVVDTKDAEGSIQRLTDHMNDLRQEGRGTAEDFIKLENEIENLTKIVEKNKKSQEGLLNTLSGMPGIFGQIGSGIKGAIGTFNTFIASAKNLKSVGLVSTLTSVASGFGLASGAAATFAAALTATGIGAFVVALGALIAYFTQTEEGAETLAVAMETLGEITSTIADAFAALIDLDFGAFVRGLTVDLFNNTVQAYENARAMQAIRDAERQLNIEREQSRTRIKELNLLAEDTTKSYEERIAAAEEAGKLERKNLDDSIKKLDERIAKEQEAINRRRDATDEEKDQLAELLIEREKFNQESIELQTTLQNKLNTLRDQQTKAIRKAINDLYNEQEKAFQAERDLAERIDNAQTDLLKARFQEFKNTKELEKGVFQLSLDEQLKLLAEFNKKEKKLTSQIYADKLAALTNQLLKEQDAVKQAAREAVGQRVQEGKDYKDIIDKKNEDIANLEELYNVKRKVVRQEFANALFAIDKNSEEEQTKIIEGEAKKRLDKIKKITEKRLKADEETKKKLLEQEKALQEELNILNDLRQKNDDLARDLGVINEREYLSRKRQDLEKWVDEQRVLYADNFDILAEIEEQYRLKSLELDQLFSQNKANIYRQLAQDIANIFAGENGLSAALNVSFTNVFDNIISMFETFRDANATLLDDTMATLGTIGSAIQAIGDISDAVTEQRLQNIDAELQTSLNALGQQKDAGILSEQEYQDAVFAERLDAYNREEELRKKAFERNKALGIVNAVISTAQAVISAFNAGASLGPSGVVMGPLMAAIAAAAGIAQIAVIASQKYTPGAAPTAPSGISGGVPSVPSVPSAGNAQGPNVQFVGTGSNLNTAGYGKYENPTINANLYISETEITGVQTTVSEYEQIGILGN